MSQSKLASMKETATNMVIGSAISYVIVFACMKYITEPALAAGVSVALCTVASFARGYTIRRHYNRKESSNGSNR
jgi:sulfur relay (sulfurtransferase) complex TusBCD TusD component (DsrE family)